MTRSVLLAPAIGALLFAAACATTTPESAPAPAIPAAAPVAAPEPVVEKAVVNPLLAEWKTPYAAPPFQDIKPEHFLPGYEEALKRHRLEIATVKNHRAASTFDTVILPLEKSGWDLARVSGVFYNLTASDTNEALQAVEAKIAPMLAKHRTDILLDADLFAKVKAVKEANDPALTAEQKRLVELTYDQFVRAGAQLDADKRARVAVIDERLAGLSVEFDQKVLADTKQFQLVLETEADLAGLPQFLVDGARQTATDLGMPGKAVITISRSSVEPFLTFSTRRDLREKAWRAWIMRGDNGDAEDTKAIVAETVSLRTEKAQLLGYKTYADYALGDQMAKTPTRALELMNRVWAPARKRALAEAADLQKMVDKEKGGFKVQPWDWRYYSEKVRKARFDVSEEETKPYFQLDKTIEGVFYLSNRLYGLSFKERKDVPVYHPDVRVWEVTGPDGRFVGLFYGDFFARPSKRGGAWMNSFREQERLRGDMTPLVVNNLNYVKGKPGEPTLLSYDDAETLFHEFGHALHGLLSNVTYPTLSGTNVPRDFVEYPSQVMERWFAEPEILSRYALHYQTGEPMPAALQAKIRKAATFNQGFATVEYLSSAFVDMKLHTRTTTDPVDVAAFEKATLAEIGMPSQIVMRHRTPHFGHIMGGYAAGYYAYLWSEVLDADTFAAFQASGDVFNPTLAKSYETEILSRGNSRDLMNAYVAFRGQEPTIEPLLKARGLQ